MIQKNPFAIAADIMFENPHFVELMTFPGKGSVPAIRGNRTTEEIRSEFGIYEDVSTVASVQKRSLTVIGTPRKGDVCYFDSEPGKYYMVQSTVEDSASQTVDLALGEYLK